MTGKFKLYTIKQTEDTYPIEYLKNENKEVWFEEMSISDKLRFESEERKRKLSLKIRIQQMKEITAFNVVEIDGKFHKVFNAYHFTNNDGFKQTDLTLEEYPRVKMEAELCLKQN